MLDTRRKKNAYFIQVDISAYYDVQNAYLPYAAGILAANAWQSEIVQQAYRFKEFVFLREEIDAVVARMEQPAFAAFSNYCWSTEYNKALAAAIKTKFPQCIIVFGGHNVPNDFTFLEEYDYIDYLIHGEGEESLQRLMEVIATGGNPATVPNLSFRAPDGRFIRTQTRLPGGLDFPSPYLEGWFDALMRQHPEITFNAILETSRGCPHQCAYCDWGLLKSKVRLFPIERIKAEIKWMSEHRIAFVWGADANFGLFSRDLEIADALVEAKEKNGYPERMRMNYAKNNYENVFAIVKKFKACDFDRIGATLSFQSMSPTVLQNIGRKNDSLEFYKNLLTAYNKENMKTYSELILGLPGETYESFIAGIGKLFEIGQHFVFEVYNCILLPNAALGQKEIIEKFGIETVKTEIFRFHVRYQPYDIPEYNTVITQTNTMSREMWVRSMCFFWLARTYHSGGLLRVFALYLFYEKQIPFETFYDGIIDFFERHPDLFSAKLYFTLKEHAKEQSVGANNRKLTFAPCGDVIWDDHEYLFLQTLNHFDVFYEEILPYLKQYEMEQDIFNDLLLYQKSVMRRLDDAVQTVSLSYDIHAFLNNIYINQPRALEKKKHTLKLRDTSVQSNWRDFGKIVVWYGRMGWSSYKDDIEKTNG